jgi:uncharacterized protein YdbL (DUF1318 family)
VVNRVFGYLGVGLMLAACVTINIYFPAAAAEEAAREIVRDVLKGDDPQPRPMPPSTDDKQSAVEPPPQLLVWLVNGLDKLIPAAAAAEADITISSPAINALRKKMARRQQQLAPFYRSGAIGFDRQGTLSLRDANSVNLAERNRLKQLLSQENRDRDALYREIAKANGHPEWEAKIRATFAKVWVDEAPAGYWYQDAKGGWRQR